MSRNSCFRAYGERCARAEDLSRNLAAREIFARCKIAFDLALVELGAAKPGKCNPWYYPSVSEYSTLAERNGFEVRFITLFDRPTGLADGAAGMRNWIVMFGADYLAKAGEARREEFLGRVEEMLRPKLFRDGQWWADYRRLRLVAYK